MVFKWKIFTKIAIMGYFHNFSFYDYGIEYKIINMLRVFRNFWARDSDGKNKMYFRSMENEVICHQPVD